MQKISLLFLVILYFDTILGVCPFLLNTQDIVQQAPLFGYIFQGAAQEKVAERCMDEIESKLDDGAPEPDPDTTTVLGCTCDSICSATIDFDNANCDWCYTKDNCGHYAYSRGKYYDYCIYPEKLSEANDWRTKDAILYQQLVADKTPGMIPNVLDMLFESIQTTFDNNWDVMPAGRLKYIHPVGAVCKIDFTVRDNKYSGIFEQGVTSGFLRMGSAGAVGTSGITPGMGFKFMRTKVKSANFPTLYNLDGIPGYDFFSVEESTHIAPPSGALTVLALKFNQASNCATKVGLSDAARWNQNGDETTDPRFPYKLVMRPTTAAGNVMPNTQQTLEEMLDAFRAIPIGTTLWNVYAQADPADDQLDVLGNITITSTCDSSAFGDSHFHIRHQRIEEDWKLRPEWIPYINPGDCKKGQNEIDVVPPQNCTYEEANN